MKLVDKDDVLSLVDDIIADSGYRHTWVATIRRGIADLPEAVVRCRDCEYWDMPTDGISTWARCDFFSCPEKVVVETNANGFCSDGARKEDR